MLTDGCCCLKTLDGPAAAVCLSSPTCDGDVLFFQNDLDVMKHLKAASLVR